jgi:hypothetical protein
MITPEEFQDLAKQIGNEEPVSAEQAKAVLTTIYELDANLVILQNALELAVENAQQVIPAVAEKVLSMSGRTDSKSKKKAATFAAEITARFELAIQLYLSGASQEAQKMLYEMDQDAAASLEEDTTTSQEATNE